MSITYQPTLEWLASQPDEQLVEIWWQAGRINHEDRRYWLDLLPKLRGMQSESADTKPSARIVRGLEWILAHAKADFEVGSGEKGTGMFAGTTESEVDAALDYLRAFCTRHDARRGKR